MRRRAFLLALASLGLPAARAEARLEFGRVVPGRSLRFPADHGAHPEFRTEWWYATGWLALPDGRPLGFQSTFFRVRSGLGEANPSAFAPRQLILAHAALADPDLGRLRHTERSARVGFGRAGYALGKTSVWLDDWRFEQHPGGYRAELQAEDFGYSLDLQTSGPPLLNGNAGFSRKAPDPRHASYYYSRPGLKVSGTVTLAGRSRPVSGQAWLDHEWSSELMPQDAHGWDWIGINLHDGSALMAFRMRGAADASLWSAATWRAAQGATRTYAPEEVAFEAQRHWRSPRSGIVYPVAWQVRVGSQTYQVEALMPDQELDSRRSTGAIYWEGAVRLMQAGREVGRGYLEMTGYGEKLRLGE
jgi:predicted secreted hydrolase